MRTSVPRSARLGPTMLPVPLALALVLHAGLAWQAAAELPGPQPAPAPALALEVRTIETAVTAPIPQIAPAVREPARRRIRAREGKAIAPVIQPPETTAPSTALAGDADRPAAAAVDADLVKPVAAAPPAPSDMKVPVYRTVMPPPAILRYDMQRGFISGAGEISWRPSGDSYEMKLQGSVAGLSVLTEVSTGLLDAHGIAPVRYTDSRARRGTTAANFQRDKGKITYSGPQVEFPLLPGSQDRLSWMVQIAAVLNAQPQLASPGERITFFVTGTHGDAEVWTFRYVGADSVRTGAGVVRAVKFTREPRKAYDRTVEVWLAPDRRHLPVRARFTAQAGESAFELLLRDMRLP